MVAGMVVATAGNVVAVEAVVVDPGAAVVTPGPLLALLEVAVVTGAIDVTTSPGVVGAGDEVGLDVTASSSLIYLG